jgi:hypothetical protein
VERDDPGAEAELARQLRRPRLRRVEEQVSAGEAAFIKKRQFFRKNRRKLWSRHRPLAQNIRGIHTNIDFHLQLMANPTVTNNKNRIDQIFVLSQMQHDKKITVCVKVCLHEP